jgi:hypothetical protein
MSILQLNPSIPVIVTSKDNRAGEAMFLQDRSPEHFNYWGVVFDDTGEIWWVPNNEVRVTNCWTTGRPPRGKT